MGLGVNITIIEKAGGLCHVVFVDIAQCIGFSPIDGWDILVCIIVLFINWFVVLNGNIWFVRSDEFDSVLVEPYVLFVIGEDGKDVVRDGPNGKNAVPTSDMTESKACFSISP